MLKLLKNMDIYRRPVGINLDGEGTYKTKLGAICTIAAYTIILAFAVMTGIKFVTGDKQE